LLDFNPQTVRSSTSIYIISLYHVANIIVSCIWKHTHVLTRMNLINRI